MYKTKVLYSLVGFNSAVSTSIQSRVKQLQQITRKLSLKIRRDDETNVKMTVFLPLKREFRHFITFPMKFKPHDHIKLLTINPENVSVNYPTALTLQIIDIRGPSLGEGHLALSQYRCFSLAEEIWLHFTLTIS